MLFSQDYRVFLDNIEFYNELVTEDSCIADNENDAIRKMMRSTLLKKGIMSSQDLIIAEYVTKFENDPKLLDKEVVLKLQNFLDLLFSEKLISFDYHTAGRIAYILFLWYQDRSDLEAAVTSLERFTYCDALMMQHMPDYSYSKALLFLLEHKDKFDTLSDKAKLDALKCYSRFAIRKDSFTKQLNVCAILENFVLAKEKEGIFVEGSRSVINKTIGNALSAICEAFYSNMCAKINGEKEPYILNTVKLTPIIRQYYKRLLGAIEKDELIGMDRSLAKCVVWQSAYYVSDISLGELLHKFIVISRGNIKYSDAENASALFWANGLYLTFLHFADEYSEEEKDSMAKRVIDHVVLKTKRIKHKNTVMSNYVLRLFLAEAANYVDFEKYYNIILNLIVFGDKSLYVHSEMVKEISRVLLSKMISKNPEFLDGVCDKDYNFFKENRSYAFRLMEQCALFHDIGKYFCLDLTTDSSRSLTMSEFEAIKKHPVNFENILGTSGNEEFLCVHDVAVLHHLYHDGKGGYPLDRKHTKNKPFVDIIAVADSIDAATDAFGRPYGKAKNLESLIQELNLLKGTRYSKEVVDLLSESDVIKKIELLITRGRRNINYSIYSKGRCDSKMRKEDGKVQVLGDTKVYGLIGYPIEHSLSPTVQNAMADANNENMVYVPFPMENGDVKTALEGAYALGIQGLNVTAPYKNQVVPYLKELSPMAEKTGSVNTLKRVNGGFKGYNTDGYGFLRAITEDGIIIEGQNFVVLGNGGVSKTVQYILHNGKAKNVCVFDREAIRKYKEDHKLPFEGEFVCIQASSAGMHPNVNEIAIDDDYFFKNMTVLYELIYNPTETEIVKKAKSFGITTFNGMKMLRYQGEMSHEIWTKEEN